MKSSLFKLKSESPFVKLNPILHYDDDLDCFLMKGNRYLDIVQMQGRDLMSISEDDLEMLFAVFRRFLQTYGNDVKLIAINQPTSTTAQQTYWNHILSKTKNPNHCEQIKLRIKKLKEIAKTDSERAYFLMFFGSSKDELIDNRNNILSSLHHRSIRLAHTITRYEKVHIFTKFNNMNTDMPGICPGIPESVITQKDIRDSLNKRGYNSYLTEQIQPAGGISFIPERSYVLGDGYNACLHVFQYPRAGVNDLWLTYLMNIEHTIVTIDIATMDMGTVRRNINRSIREQKSRIDTNTRNETDQAEAAKRWRELKELAENITEMNESIKTIHTRIYVSDATQEKLDNRILGIKKYLEHNGYLTSIALNESKDEYLAFFRSATQQSYTQMRRYGQPLPATSIAGGFPFDFTGISDPLGFPYGSTATGKAIYDLYMKTTQRTSYNGVIFGKTGFGKSTLQKLLILDRAIRGDYVWYFDTKHEYDKLTEYLGGKVITLAGDPSDKYHKSYVINIFDIFKTDPSESISYNIHIGKLSAIFKFLNPGITDDVMWEFATLCKQLYIQVGVVPASGEILDLKDGESITGLPPEKYPIFSDLYDLIIKERQAITKMSAAQRESNRQRDSRLDLLQSAVKNIIQNYGSILNHHTNLENNLMENKIVCFNVQNLSNMEEEIFDAMVFNALMLAWTNAIKKGTPMKDLWESGQIDWQDITRYLILIDESHRFINASKMTAFPILKTIQKEDRKLFTGLILASQSIRDFVPQGSSASSVAQLSQLFEETQYKFIMFQDSNTKDTLNAVFYNQLTAAELANISQLEQGECILSISGSENIQFNIEASEADLALFTGGA